jgi:hypothetical protein
MLARQVEERVSLVRSFLENTFVDGKPYHGALCEWQNSQQQKYSVLYLLFFPNQVAAHCRPGSVPPTERACLQGLLAGVSAAGAAQIGPMCREILCALLCVTGELSLEYVENLLDKYRALDTAGKSTEKTAKT